MDLILQENHKMMQLPRTHPWYRRKKPTRKIMRPVQRTREIEKDPVVIPLPNSKRCPYKRVASQIRRDGQRH
jgi:RNase P protein component